MSLVKKMKVEGALRTPYYEEVLDDKVLSDGNKILADEDIEVTVNGKIYKGNTIARSLMVDVLIQDLTVPSPTALLQGSAVPIDDVKEAHRLATEQAQLIFG